ncbi:hypothetical protein L7F22_019303 [Adiantum nelumboides]|nr:hypothetical protein [Adiantum nelumboides]
MVHLPPIKSIIHGDAKDTAFIRFTALSAKRITFSKFEQVVIRQRVQISISQSETISILLVYLYSQDNIQHALLIKGKKGVWTERCDRILDGRGKAIPLTPKRRSTFYHLYNIWEKEQNESVSIFARRYILEEEVSQISSTLKRITALQHLEKVKILEKENSSLLINKRIDFLYKNLVIIGIESQCNTPARYTLNDLELGIEEDIRIAEAPRQNIQSEQRQEFLASIIDPDLIPENGDDEQEEEVEILSEENQYSSAFIGIAPEAPSISQTTLLGIQTQADISRIHSEVVVRPALQRLEEIRSLEDLEVVEEETPIDPDLSTTSSMVAQLIDSLLQNRSRQQSIYSFFHQQAPDLIIPTSSGSDSISNYRPELTPLQLDATALVQSIYPQTQIPPTTQEDIVIPLPEEIGVFIEDAENQSFEEVQIRICAIDPGIRTFATIIDPIRCKGFRWGEQDFQRLVIIRKKISRIQSELSMPLKNSKKRAKQEVIFRLWQKHNNLVRDLHIRLSKWLNENYDVVFLPKLDVARMVRKKGRFNPPPPPRITTVPTQAEQIAEIQRRREERKKGRKINKQTAASMHALAHSKFYNRLQETMGFLPTITEEFTSQGCSSCGTRKTNLGSAKVYNCPNPLCQLRADRDLNGAKNILQKIIIEVEKLGTVPS